MKNKIPDFALNIFLISSVLFILTTPVSADVGDTTLRRGMIHPDVALLQEKLSILGYFEADEFINNFGPKTEAALKAFQRDNDLEQDGIAGKATFSQLNAKIRQAEILPEDFEPLKEGDSGDKVVDIQKKLRNLDIYKTEVSSIYDRETTEAVISFQNANKLAPTGIVDKDTLIALNTASDKLSADRASASRRRISTKLVEYAKKYLGVPYKWGGNSGKSFDCSGFILYIMKKFNVELEHSASGQFNQGIKVEKEDLQAGDLVFFTTYKKGPSHVGMYIGDNKFIHASSGAHQVTITDLDMNYYRTRYLGARRYNITDSE